MKTSAEYLDDIKTAHHIESDYAAAKLLGVTRSAVSNYRLGKSGFDEDVALRAAELLRRDPEELMLASRIERAKDDATRAPWVRLAKRSGYGPAIGIMSTSRGRRREGFRDLDAPQHAEKPGMSGLFFRIESARRRLS